MSDFKTRTGRIAFQGEQGANSDTACRNVFPKMEPLACPTFEDVFESIVSGEADLAMIPIENTLAGRVADIHQLLPRFDLHIIGEYFLPIHFHLMAPKGAKLEDIKRVHSHIHAFGQCRTILREYGFESRIAADTAGAARLVAEKGDREDAALAPKLAAQLHNLDILRENVEDANRNVTRFIIMSPKAENAPNDGKPAITSFIFRVRNVPAALYKVLGGFATNGVNMTKLESYQLDGFFSATLFYADVEGHLEDESLKLALEEMDFFCAERKILGVYPASPFRYEGAEV